MGFGGRAGPAVIGRMSCGQADMATMQSSSARRVTESPGVVVGGSKESLPSAVQGMFMKRLSGLGHSGGVSPRACMAANRLSVQLS
jgi:hypothetical protein